MQFPGIGAEQSEQMPEKKQPGREGKKKLIGQLRRETGGVVGRRLPDQTSRRPPNEPERLHFAQVYFAARNYPLNSRRPIPM